MERITGAATTISVANLLDGLILNLKGSELLRNAFAAWEVKSLSDFLTLTDDDCQTPFPNPDNEMTATKLSVKNQRLLQYTIRWILEMLKKGSLTLQAWLDFDEQAFLKFVSDVRNEKAFDERAYQMRFPNTTMAKKGKDSMIGIEVHALLKPNDDLAPGASKLMVENLVAVSPRKCKKKRLFGTEEFSSSQSIPLGKHISREYLSIDEFASNSNTDTELLTEKFSSELEVDSIETRESENINIKPSRSGDEAKHARLYVQGHTTEGFVASHANTNCDSEAEANELFVDHAILYDRENEENELIASFDRCILKSPTRQELILVTGKSGTGKTFLTENTLRPLVVDRGGFFISGKFDLLERSEQYYPVMQAISAFVVFITQDSHRLVNIKKALASYKETTRLLLDSIPLLAELSSDDTMARSLASETAEPCQTTGGIGNNRQSCHGAATRERLKFAIRDFFTATCSISKPVVLFLDDLQWGEPATLDLIGSLISPGIPGLIVVGACRDNELSQFAYLSILLRELEKEGVKISQVAVDNIKIEGLTEMLGDSLQIEKCQAMTLGSIILKQTGGNMFYVKQFLRSLVDESLLYRKHATWHFESENRIKALLGEGDDATHLISLRIQQQDKETQDTLMVASCLGADFGERLLDAAVSYDVQPSLRVAKLQGFLKQHSCPSSSNWRFTHDQIQQSSYSLIPVHEREKVHLHIGRNLWKKLTEHELNNHANVVVKQLKLGARLITREDEREQMALLLLRSGELASKSAAHVTAKDYFALGISMLSTRHWRDQYLLSLALYNAATEVEHCLGNFTRVEELVDDILRHARSVKDKIRAQTNRIYSLTVCNQLQEAIDVGLTTLDECFRITFPSKPSKSSIVVEMMKTKWMLRRFSDDEILALPENQDPVILGSMRIMVLLYYCALFCRTMLAPILVMKLIRSTLTHGVSGMSSLILNFYSQIHFFADDLTTGVRFGKLSMRLLEKFDAKEWLPRLICGLHSVYLTYVEPLRDQVSPLLHAHRIGRGTGDIEYSLMSAVLYTTTSIFSGAPLLSISNDIASFLSLAEFYHQIFMIQLLKPYAKFVQYLLGVRSDPKVLHGLVLDLEPEWNEAVQSNNVALLNLILSIKMTVAGFFNQYDKVKQLGKEMRKYGGGNSLPVHIITHARLQEGIALAYLSRNQKKHNQLKCAGRILKKFQRQGTFSDHNFGNKISLLKAEISFASDQSHLARHFFMHAIEKAKQEELWNEVGLACERFSIALSHFCNHDDARFYIIQATDAYKRWGAIAKVAELHPRNDDSNN